MPRYWYNYVPGANPSPTLPANYRLSTIKPTCVTGSTICSVYSSVPTGAAAPTILPSLSNRLSNYITNGLSTNAAQPVTGKFFVYLKS
ncbi:hypothetical protein SAMN05443550_1213 [Pedobacter hartonius]|uniref:Uncharacterized protein n=1 Tax=Pedobacter hartonius TaxID=425514 RepID=A0A1H4HIY7_9SPHI|nr:hypothetical protein SAMN05443550_1213 [Pedobacter hartonius]